MITKRALYILIFSLVIFIAPFLKADAASLIKVLLVPGHDGENWGAEYGNIKESSMNLAVATKIFDLLKKDGRFDVAITRTAKGYTKEFANYFISQRNEILAFRKEVKQTTEKKIADGSFVIKDNVPHNKTKVNVAQRLYGLNKWADDNKIDLVIHIHFNDNNRSNKWKIGKDKGFVIYVPDKQFANSLESSKLAENIFLQLKKKYSVSTYKPESIGIVSEQKLIAIGANNSLNASVRSILIEYGYIYEKQFRVKKTRLEAYGEMASFTTEGIKNYFFAPTDKLSQKEEEVDDKNIISFLKALKLP